jgi:hypothetical protein
MEKLKSTATRVLIITLVCMWGSMTAQANQQPRFNLDALAAKGMAIAQQDPIATELRNQQPDASARRGFDIGMGIAETDTFPGPGKQQLHDLLLRAEQSGFEVAVTFSLARNRKKLTDLAPRGAELTRLDPLAAELRNQQFNEDARLGFDIEWRLRKKTRCQVQANRKCTIRFIPQNRRGSLRLSLSHSIAIGTRSLLGLARTSARLSSDVGLARNVDRDVFRRLGFDIAAGLYGDPALGSKGSTKMGPGALAIRDALSPATQRDLIRGQLSSAWRIWFFRTSDCYERRSLRRRRSGGPNTRCVST